MGTFVNEKKQFIPFLYAGENEYVFPIRYWYPITLVNVNKSFSSVTPVDIENDIPKDQKKNHI